MKNLKSTLLLFLFLFAASLGIHAQTVSSVANGDWSVGSTWSSGTVPNGSEDIRIAHAVKHASTLTIQSTGTLTVLSEGQLRIGATLINKGTINNYDTIIVNTIHGPQGGFDNSGTVNNYAYFITTGTLENQADGTFNNYNSVQLNGDLENFGTFLNTGFVFMTGDLENRLGGLVTSPSGESGYWDVCGSATHRTGATVTGINYLCVRCGGSYVKQPGRIGDFVEECRPFTVSLVSFKATWAQPGIVRLNWQTATEASNAWFVVERAFVEVTEQCTVGKCESPIEFIEIGRVPGAGNSTALLSYVFTDPFPKAGVNFYRLKMVDANNNFNYSPTVSVVVNAPVPVMLAFPNPTQEVLHLRISGTPSQEATISMYAIDGKLVWKQNNPMIDGRAEVEIATCDFSSGTYLVEFKQGDRKETKKVVFQK